MKPSVVVAFVTGAALASGIVYVAVRPDAERPALVPQLAAVHPPVAVPQLVAAIPPIAEQPKAPDPPAIQREVEKPAAVAPPPKVAHLTPQPTSPKPYSRPATLKMVSQKMVSQVAEPFNEGRSLDYEIAAKTAPPTPVAVQAAGPPPPVVVQAPTPAAAPALGPVSNPAPEPAAAPEPPSPPKVKLQAGANLDVRIGETLSTRRNRPGDNFLATLTGPLVIDGWVIAERGARVEGRVVESDPGGRVQGTARLSVELVRLSTSDGQRIRIQTEPIDRKAKASTGEDAAKVGGGAALGAIIGAIAGGGKGAGIGAGAGGAAGAGDVLLTRGKPAEIPVESRLTFRVANPVEITEKR